LELSLKVSESYQTADLNAFQQLATQASEIPQLFFKNNVMAGGKTMGGLEAGTLVD
jgi:hypothetical protein